MTTPPALVLLPGMDGTGDLFRPFLNELKPEQRVITVSYPTDAALSYDELLAGIRAQLPETPYILVAESFSGPLAIMLAAQNPMGLVGLVLCATFVKSPLRWYLHPLLPVVRQRVGKSLPPASIIKWGLTGSRPREGLIDDIRRSIHAVSGDVLRKRIDEIKAVDVTHLAGRILAPVLYLRATRDRLVQENALDEVIDSIPQLSVEEIDSPHLLLQSEPKKAADAIDRFVGGLFR